MDLQQSCLLPALIALPLITGVLCWLVEKKNAKSSRYVALLGMGLTLLVALFLCVVGDFGNTAFSAKGLPWIARFETPWIPIFGIRFALAMDGLSLCMILLTAFLGMLAIGCSWGEIRHRVGFFHLNLLWSLAGVIGVFLAIDLFLFFFFWEMMLLPIYFLIALWGHDVKDATGKVLKSKSQAALKFFVYTQASGFVMLVGIFMLALIHYAASGALSFHYEDLLGTYLGPYEYAIMLCFFVGFAVKLPIFPLHGWLPDAHAQAPTAGSVDLAGILIKTAAFGLLRFVLPLFPEASAQFAPVAIFLGLIGVFYGAFAAFAQTDMKRLLAYTSISHMGFVVLAIYAGTLLSLQGLMAQMIAHGLSSAALFIMAGQLYERLGTRDMTLMGGMWGQFRYFAPFLMFFCAALLGIPGTGNFVGEILIVMGAFGAFPWTAALLTLSFVWAGLYALILVYRALFGDNTCKSLAQSHNAQKALSDLGKREKGMLCALALGLLWLGFYPNAVFRISQPSMQYLADISLAQPTSAVEALLFEGKASEWVFDDAALSDKTEQREAAR